MDLGPLPVKYHFPQILEIIGQKLGTYIGCEGLDREDQFKHIKFLIELKSDVNSFNLIEILSGRGPWTINPSLYNGVIDISDILIKESRIEESNQVKMEPQRFPGIIVNFMENKGGFYMEFHDDILLVPLVSLSQK